jgi:hypothetical protein
MKTFQPSSAALLNLGYASNTYIYTPTPTPSSAPTAAVPSGNPVQNVFGSLTSAILSISQKRDADTELAAAEAAAAEAAAEVAVEDAGTSWMDSPAAPWVIGGVAVFGVGALVWAAWPREK